MFARILRSSRHLTYSFLGMDSQWRWNASAIGSSIGPYVPEKRHAIGGLVAAIVVIVFIFVWVRYRQAQLLIRHAVRTRRHKYKKVDSRWAEA